LRHLSTQDPSGEGIATATKMEDEEEVEAVGRTTTAKVEDPTAGMIAREEEAIVHTTMMEEVDASTMSLMLEIVTIIKIVGCVWSEFGGIELGQYQCE
jgi:hypothetical protein